MPFGHQQIIDLYKAITKTFNDGLSDGGDCGGDEGWDGEACTMPENTLNISSDGVVLYNSNVDMAGF